MFRLAHISDIHIAPLPKPALTELISKRLTGYLNWKRSRKNIHARETLDALVDDMQNQKPDHTVITGDLVNIALDQELRNAVKFLENLGKPEELTVVCGNHDAYVPGALGKAIDHWQPWIGPKPLSAITVDDFPLVQKIDDVALISCNSAESTPPFFATGYFRQQQADRLRKLLKQTGDDGLCRIVLIHHPPIPNSTRFHKRLIGGQRFLECIQEEGAELVLHGHTHVATRAFVLGKNGDVPVIGVSSASTAPDNRHPLACYNLFEISRNDSGWSIDLKIHGTTRSIEHMSLLGEHTLT